MSGRYVVLTKFSPAGCELVLFITFSKECGHEDFQAYF
jgi:hypothetical protein